MKIMSIGVSLPTLKKGNDDIINDIRKFNRHHSATLIEQYIKLLRHLFKKSGADTRFWRDRDSGESANQLLRQAINDALDQVKIDAASVDMLIYVGVGRGFLEPANAYFCAKMMGMKCECFDISDACMSYVRALDIAQGYLVTGKYKNILIVNAECTVYEYGYPELFKVHSLEQMKYTFPTYTIGEAATATLVNADGDDWIFQFDSVPDLANLCTIPLEGFEGFIGDKKSVGQHGVNRFVSFSAEMFRIATERMVNLVKETIEEHDAPDIWFPHAAAEYPCLEIANNLGIDLDSIYIDSFGRYGNLASASIPVAIWSAIRENKLKRGMKVVLAPASAGMSFATVQLVY